MSRIVASLLVALGVAVGGWLAGRGLAEGRRGDRYVTVKGVAERDVEADLALWPIRFVVTGDELAKVQAESQSQASRVLTFLEAAGIARDAVEVQSIDVTDVLAQAYRSGTTDSRFIVSQTLLVRSTDVSRIEDVSQRVSTLIETGVVLSAESGAGPYYLFTRLNDVKPEMIAEATRRAREGAEQFAADSGNAVGGIRRANQGLFQILPRDDAPGITEQRQVRKTVRVVSTVEYLLVD